ncbi:MAG: hypothetical protein K1X64_20580 [Myxococcaceae bacterium]|nr:hypothetical protein [Myxococcaceae bacterium]
MNARKTLLTAVLLVGTAAAAQQTISDYDRGPIYRGHYSVLTGRTVGAGNFVVHPEIGYPAVSVTLLSGMRDRFDFGGRFTVGYNNQTLAVNEPFAFAATPTLGAQAIMRWNWVNQEFVSFGARMEPGVLFGVVRGAAATLVVPFGLDLGLHPHRVVAIGVGAEVGLGAVLGYAGGAAFILPVSVGPGLEFNLSDSVQLTLNSRFGGYSFRTPSDIVSGVGGFGFRASVGLAFRT